MLLIVSVVLAALVLLVTQRRGARAALPLTGLLCLSAALLANATVGIAPLMGLIAGFQVERGRPFGEVVAAAALPAAVLSLWLLVASTPGTREQAGAELATQLQAMGVQLDEGGQEVQELMATVLRVQPALEFASMLLAVVLAYSLAAWLAVRLELDLPPGRPLRLWRPWEELIWVLIGSLGVGLVGAGWLRDLSLNLMVVMVLLYAAQGLGVTRFYMHRLELARLLEVAIYALLLFTAGIALAALAGLGLVDTWFDWRRLRPGAVRTDEEDEQQV